MFIRYKSILPIRIIVYRDNTLAYNRQDHLDSLNSMYKKLRRKLSLLIKFS